MQEVKEDDKIILFIDEVHTLIGAGAAEGAIDAANKASPCTAPSSGSRRHHVPVSVTRAGRGRDCQSANEDIYGSGHAFECERAYHFQPICYHTPHHGT